ncbi:class IV lanthionine synthetase LanL [Streptomyces sp. NPDC056069]|uniref:class IV lanthionine synthetase LanL n=1 Tax=Streptomyces sp. NPDC056069 TaxID=3345702 RepID=UPI0035D6DED3
MLINVIRGVLDGCGGQLWSMKPERAWCYLSPPDGIRLREHGWKLHVSATPLSAPIVLARAGEVLVRAGCAFKFGTDLRRVSELVDQWYDRGGGSKFITVYPRDDAQFRELAEQLHEATVGLPGPRILSDRQLRRGSLVYYRYGEITRSDRRVLTDDGIFKWRMVGPDGTAVEDKRNAWFSPPPWASSPFPDEQVVVPQAPASVLLGGRYRVRKAIRHAHKGGVYRATDVRDGSDVIIKHARAHVSSGLDGTDVRDRLRQESQILQELQPLDVTPGWIDLMQLDEDLFLVQEQIPGQTLETWAREHGDGSLSVSESLKMASRLLGVIEKIHASGYVIRDFKSSNVMIRPDGDMRIIDVEFAIRNGAAHRPAGTPYFTAPEMMAASALPFSTAADCYSLGVTLFQSVTGLSPAWMPRKGSAHYGVGEVLARISAAHPVVPVFADLIIGLTEPDPKERWSVAQARDWLTALSAETTAPVRPHAQDWLSDDRLDALIHEQTRLLQTSAGPTEDRLWKVPFHEDTDVCALWTGAAGGLAALTWAAAHGDDTLREAVADAAAWIDHRLFSIPRLLPGLAFGRAGTAWALYNAGGFLEDAELQARALDLASRLPVQWPMADITHGLSGAGMTHLHLWHATGKPECLDLALACADAVLDAAHRDGDDWSWPIPAEVDSDLAGQSTNGFAHGVAGVGAFLLAASQAAEYRGRGSGQRYREAALAAGNTLARTAVPGSTGVRWPRSAGSGSDDVQSGMHWCNGAAGIGSFLIRLYTATGEQRFADLCEQAAATVVHNPWAYPVGACCGLAGAGHFLLDMAHYTGLDSYRGQALGIAAVIDTHDAVITRAAEKRTDYSYQSGVAGVLGFYLRLRHGGSHPWMPDPAETAAGIAHGSNVPLPPAVGLTGWRGSDGR